MRKFPHVPDGKQYRIPFSEASLIRGSIAAGRDPEEPVVDRPERAHLDGLANLVVSSLDTTGSRLQPTDHYYGLGSTEKTAKTFGIGKALCAHAALSKLGIPWLVDFEKLPDELKVKTVRKTKKRPDYLGQNARGDWYVFEAKGRSTSPSPGEFTEWKDQANTIRTINGSTPKSRIVSAAYLNADGEWQIDWEDPLPEDGVDLPLSAETFFEAYYRRMVAALREAREQWISSPLGPLILLGQARILFGLAQEVWDALEGQRFGSIVEFALARDNGKPTRAQGGVWTFPDGVLIKRLPRGGPYSRVLKSIGRIRKQATLTAKTNPQMPVHSERETQDRVVALLRDELGYRYLGNWSDRYKNSNIEEMLFSDHLTKAGYSKEQISRALYLLRTEADNPNRSLYDNNRAVYSLLRYGVGTKIEAGTNTETVRVIDWQHPELNDFAIAEEVTLKGGYERRPDLVLYVNGIAIAVIELKSGHASVGKGIRQSLSNQAKEFNEWFYSTVQFIFAGNDSEGLRYGTIKTEEKYFLQWKEDEADNTRFKLDKYLLKMCRRDRLIELMHDFVLFDGGTKKLPRVHQYFGIKAAQEHVNRLEGGIIWHTQGSGKSIVMVLLAKWILENRAKARVLILTDRDELDKQIERVFLDSGEPIYRTSSGHDLMAQLGQAAPRLLCSLIHKFGKKGVEDYDAFIEELKAQPSPAVGELFIFVDECHRTQNGRLHHTMKALLPSAVFIGFTGTPLLKQDKATSFEVFGSYIHTYKFGEAVEDEVVLDLVYEARDIEQTLGSQNKIDAWFDAKTKGLNDWQKAALREQWGTMQKVLSSRSRMERVVEDIVFDFGTRPRLSDGRGNAMLVASSIYEACKYYELFQKTAFKGVCALVTSYNPQTKDITLEDTGANTETDKQSIFNTYTALLKDVSAKPGMTKTETYEEEVKDRFKKQPANMRLLIVVDKLLTGFDAPSCTYVYLDKKMQDHGLFQAICRTNRLDGEDKTFGYVVDYKDLFTKVENAIAVYSAELDDSAGGGSPEVMIQDRLKKGRERLDAALEAAVLLCDPVQPPRGELEHIHYFCGNTDLIDDLKTHEPQRVAFYKAVAGLTRAYANIADDLALAGYTPGRIETIKGELNHFVKLRTVIRQASGETIDLKAFEADMRHLIDTYIQADEPRRISDFGEIGLLDLIVNSGIAEAINSLHKSIKGNKRAVAETIANNVRSKIIKDHLNDPAYYDRMSSLLQEILADLKEQRISYEEFLQRIADLATKVLSGKAADTPVLLNTPGRRALYHNLGNNEALALEIDAKVRQVRPNNFRGNQAKENMIKAALLPLLRGDAAEVERIFLVIKAQTEY